MCGEKARAEERELWGHWKHGEESAKSMVKYFEDAINVGHELREPEERESLCKMYILLGDAYREGRGAVQNYARALEYFEQAAAMEDCKALQVWGMSRLGRWYCT